MGSDRGPWCKEGAGQALALDQVPLWAVGAQLTKAELPSPRLCTQPIPLGPQIVGVTPQAIPDLARELWAAPAGCAGCESVWVDVGDMLLLSSSWVEPSSGWGTRVVQGGGGTYPGIFSVTKVARFSK